MAIARGPRPRKRLAPGRAGRGRLRCERQASATAGERNGEEDDLLVPRVHLVTDRASVLLGSVTLHSLDAGRERLLGDVVGLLAERLLRADVLAVDARVVLRRRLGGELLRGGGIDLLAVGERPLRRTIDRHRFAEVRGARRLRGASVLVRGVFLDPHQLVQELVDPEGETAELGVVELEALVLLAVEDGEEPFFEHVDRAGDVVAQHPAANDDDQDPEHHHVEDRRRERRRVVDHAPRRRGRERRVLAVAEAVEQRRAEVAVARGDRVGLAAVEDALDEVLRRPAHRVLHRGARRVRRVRDDRQIPCLRHDQRQGPPRRLLAHARQLVCERDADGDHSEPLPVGASHRGVGGEEAVLPVLVRPDVRAAPPLGESVLERGVVRADVAPGVQVGAVSADHLPVLVDEHHDGGGDSLVGRVPADVAEDAVAEGGGGLFPGRVGRLLEGVQRGRVSGSLGDPAFGAEGVELEAGGGALDLVLGIREKDDLVSCRRGDRLVHEDP